MDSFANCSHFKLLNENENFGGRMNAVDDPGFYRDLLPSPSNNMDTQAIIQSHMSSSFQPYANQVQRSQPFNDLMNRLGSHLMSTPPNARFSRLGGTNQSSVFNFASPDLGQPDWNKFSRMNRGPENPQSKFLSPSMLG